MRPAARPVRRRAPLAGPAALVLVVCAGLLAACSGATLPFSKSNETTAARKPPAIVVSGMTGLPADRTDALFDALVKAAAHRGIGIGRGDFEARYALAGEFAPHASDTGMSVRYRWTLTDASGRVLHRIEETEAAESQDEALDGVPVNRIAAHTAESLSSRLAQLGHATRAAGMPPPLDHLAQAGPGAEQEIDYETLHGPGRSGISDPSAEFRGTLAEDAPETPEAQPSERDPSGQQASGGESIDGVAITGVTGAGASGNGELAGALARVLTDAGWPVQDKSRGNALMIDGKVTLGQPNGNVQKVALRWTVKAPDGEVLGAVEQANDIPAGSLDKGWGAAADQAALAAAQGIFDLVDKLR